MVNAGGCKCKYALEKNTNGTLTLLTHTHTHTHIFGWKTKQMLLIQSVESMV